MRAYGSKYCRKFLVLFLFFSLRNAHDSICLILSLLTPIDSPISCNVFILPSSIPNLHLMTCFSLGLRLSSTFSRSCFMNCFNSSSSAVSASGSDIISWGERHMNPSENKKYVMQFLSKKYAKICKATKFWTKGAGLRVKGRKNRTDRRFKILVDANLLIQRSRSFWSQ